MAFKSFFNKDFLPVMRKYIKQLRGKGKRTFRTVDLIREYIGRYIPDKTSGNHSINANIGRFLKENEKALGIWEKEAKKPIKVGGKNTQTSVWEFI